MRHAAQRPRHFPNVETEDLISKLMMSASDIIETSDETFRRNMKIAILTRSLSEASAYCAHSSLAFTSLRNTSRSEGSTRTALVFLPGILALVISFL